MILNHLLAMTLAYVLDRMIGDPENFPHPVRWIGSGIAFLAKRLNHGNFRKLKGGLAVLFIVAIVTGITLFLTHVAYGMHRFAGIGAEALFIAAAIAAKGLADAAHDVYQPLKHGDLNRARRNLSRIVGRDTEKLSEAEVARAAVETVAENTSDGITAPLFWAFIGGAPFALAYRAINTCDSMLGYQNEKFARFGWASARLDDLVNAIPSRLTGMLMIIVNRAVHPHSKRDCFRILFRDAKKHASPNSGWLEAAMAALLGVQLGGANAYAGVITERAHLGDSRHPLHRKHIVQAVSVMHRTVFSMLAICWLGGGILAFA